MNNYNEPGGVPSTEYGGGNAPISDVNELKKSANFVGVLVIILIIAMFVAPLVVQLLAFLFGMISVTKDSQIQYKNDVVYYAVMVLSSAIPLGICGSIVSAIFDRKTAPLSRYTDESDKGENLSVSTGILTIFAGIGLCMIANVAVSIFISILKDSGVAIPDYEKLIGMKKGAWFFVGDLLLIVVVPAIFEELLFRGYAMRALRTFGNGPAVVVSALLFSLLHGNIIQIPFALLVGLVFGWVAIKTRNIYYAVAIHFFNNFLSVFLTHLGFSMDEEKANLLLNWVSVGLLLIGVASLIILFASKKSIFSKEKREVKYEKGVRAKALFSSVWLWICVVVLIGYAALTSVMIEKLV